MGRDGGKRPGRQCGWAIRWPCGKQPSAGCFGWRFEKPVREVDHRPSKGLTLFDYAHRQSLWLGRDDAFPRGVEQNLSAEFTFEPSPLEVGGVRISELNAPDRAIGEKLTVSMTLARLEGGPETVAARLVLDGVEPAVIDEQAVSLVGGPAGANLSVALPGPGACHHLELMSAGQAIYVSPPLPVGSAEICSRSRLGACLPDGRAGAIVVRVADRGCDGPANRDPGTRRCARRKARCSGEAPSLPIALVPSRGTQRIRGAFARDERLARELRHAHRRSQPNAVISTRDPYADRARSAFCPQSFYTD